MSFAIDTYGLPAIEDYASALKHWEDVKPWRGYPDSDPRPLDKNRSKKHMTIHLDPDSGDIRLKLHMTNVVTYHKDGSITLKPYSSVSTDKFANDLLPWDLNTHFNHPEFYIVTCGRRYDPDTPVRHYSIPASGMRFVKTTMDHWQPAETCPAMTLLKINRKRANAALAACGFDKFKMWFDAYTALNTLGSSQVSYISAVRAAEWLSDRDQWLELAGWIKGNGMDKLRATLIKYYGALDESNHPYTDDTTLAAITRSQAKWRYV